jgi:hypothetical protein
MAPRSHALCATRQRPCKSGCATPFLAGKAGKLVEERTNKLSCPDFLDSKEERGLVRKKGKRRTGAILTDIVPVTRRGIQEERLEGGRYNATDPVL